MITGFLMRVDLNYYRDRTRPAHQYPFRVGEVCKALRHDADHVAMHRFPEFIKRGWALGPCFCPVLDMCANEFAGNATVGVMDAPPGHHPRTTDMTLVPCDRNALYGHH